MSVCPKCKGEGHVETIFSKLLSPLFNNKIFIFCKRCKGTGHING